MTDTLQVWLRGGHLGTVQRLRNGRLRLRYTAEVLDEHGIGACPLSLSMPLTDERVQGDRLERFLANLLPEGPIRATLEREHRLRPGDTFGLLTAIGRECAGAVQLTVDTPPGEGELLALTDAQVATMVAQLPTLDPPAGHTVSASLGGVQAKVLLTRTDEGWAWPADGAMSTHIVKPEPVADAGVSDLVRWEEWTLRLAAACGVPAARARLVDFDGRTAIVVERFDRSGGCREHQEDFAQALAIAPAEKYEPTAIAPRTRLTRVVDRAGAHAVDPEVLARDLLRQVAFNLVIGNGDAHAKNYSLAISAGATYSLTPLYDAAPIYLLNRAYEHFGHVLDGQVRLRHLTLGHLLREARTWGLRASDARGEVERVAALVRDGAPTLAVDAARADAVVPAVRARAGALLDELVAGA